MKKIIALTAAVFFAGASFVAAGPHPHGPFAKHKFTGVKPAVHHNPNKPGPGSFHTASLRHGPQA